MTCAGIQFDNTGGESYPPYIAEGCITINCAVGEVRYYLPNWVLRNDRRPITREYEKD